MNKSELVAAVAAKAKITKADAERAINGFIDVVTHGVKGGKRIAVAGLGIFEARHRAARTGVNPATGAKIQIKAKKVPAFKAAKAFKDMVK